MTFDLLNLTEQKTQVLTIPAWYLDFALYTRHYQPTSGELRYATFNGSGVGGVILNCTLDILTPATPAGSNIYVIPASQDYLDLTYQVSGRIGVWLGVAIDSDIAYRGAGNSDGWIQGAGSGPWLKTLTLRINRSDFADTSEKTMQLHGFAWSVSQMGDINKVEATREITLRADPEVPAFAANFQVRGDLAYFANRTSLSGRSLPRDLHRYLGLEKITFLMSFNQDPKWMEINFNGQKYLMKGRPGYREYQLPMMLPVWPSTLTWQNERLRTPYTASLKAEAAADPTQVITAQITDLEITGDIHDIYHVQAG
jgi:hypothetical protein